MGTKYENLLESGSGNVIQSFYDNFLKSNADFRNKAGFRMTVIRESIGVCCAWCQDLVGTYDYDNRPSDIYARHKNCTCIVMTKTERGTYQDAWSRKEYESQRDARIAREREILEEKTVMPRRKVGSQGQEIIDKATYNKLTKEFIRNGGIIIRGEEAERHLALSGAYAAYVPGMNVAFIKDDAMVSDVLEEMHHAYQERKHMYGVTITEEVLIKREIEAQEYLINVAKRYKIPQEEIEVTKQNLEYYRNKLLKIKRHE